MRHQAIDLFSVIVEGRRERAARSHSSAAVAALAAFRAQPPAPVDKQLRTYWVWLDDESGTLTQPQREQLEREFAAILDALYGSEQEACTACFLWCDGHFGKPEDLDWNDAVAQAENALADRLPEGVVFEWGVNWDLITQQAQ